MQRQKPRTPVVLRDRARENRRTPTQAERKLWYLLRNRNLTGLKFRRQQAVGPYIADFLCVEHKMIAETDGLSHDGKGEYDDRRTAYLEAAGFKVLRFFDHDVLNDVDAVMNAILEAAGK